VRFVEETLERAECAAPRAIADVFEIDRSTRALAAASLQESCH
jgi:hypothetical protein